MTSLRRPLGVALLLAGLVACSDGTSEQASDTGPRSSEGTAGSVGTTGSIGTTGTTAAAGESDDATLSEFLGVGGTPEELGSQVRSTEERRQDILQECMTRQGFDYVAYAGGVGSTDSPDGLPTDLPTDEFLRLYGYGISTGFETSLGLEPREEEIDPNLDIVAAMSEAERAAYERALHGDAAGGGEPGGCDAEAAAVTSRADVVYEALGDELAEMSARVEADRRVVDAQRAWVECMDREGYPFPDEFAIEDELMRRMNPLYDAVAGEDVQEGVTVLRPGAELTAEQEGLLAEVRAYELAVAEADLGCREDLDEVRAEVQREYDARFVDEHRDQLRELVPDAGL